MKEPDFRKEPWCWMPERTCRALWAAGYTSPEQVAEIRGRELRAIPGIGPKGYKAVRAIWPNPNEDEPGTLRTPSHGVGAILAGGKPGNRGGPGAAKSRVRMFATMKFEELIPRLRIIADDKLGKVCKGCGRGSDPVSVSDQLRAIDLLGKYGPGTQRDFAQFLDFERAKSFIESLAGVVSKEVLEENVQLRIVEGFKDVIRAFFPRP